MAEAKIGIIGGSGIYDIDAFKNAVEEEIRTPFGDVKLIIGDFSGRKTAFIPRHGFSHEISPSEVNSRANIFALKKIGVERIIATSAVGSLREDIHPLDIVIPDQIFDRTKGRKSTFFEGGIVSHVSFSEPFCRELSALLYKVASDRKYRVHKKATYICIEGPQFSTKAESFFYRKMGFDIIGMTAVPEAKLAREAEICYSTIAAVTDYDVWKEEEREVTADMILSNLRKNEEAIKDILSNVIPWIPEKRTCECGNALRDAIVTHRDAISEEKKKELDVIIGKYL